MTPDYVASRWKYAEEDAKGLVDQGHCVVLMVAPDEEYEEDGEKYLQPVFHVYDIGHKDDAKIVAFVTETADGDQEVVEL